MVDEAEQEAGTEPERYCTEGKELIESKLPKTRRGTDSRGIGQEYTPEGKLEETAGKETRSWNRRRGPKGLNWLPGEAKR